jgi:hypothetical protein
VYLTLVALLKMVLLLLKLKKKKKNIVTRKYIFTLEIVKLLVMNSVDKRLSNRRKSFSITVPKIETLYTFMTECYPPLNVSTFSGHHPARKMHTIFIIHPY